MPGSDPCELHDIAVLAGEDATEELRRLARSPIGDECQICAVCRSAREFVARRLAEEDGVTLPPGQGSEAAWKALQKAIEGAKDSVHRSSPAMPRRGTH
jgi:hypothetical protein